MALLGFLDRGGIGQWAYAIAADVAVQGAEFIRFTNNDIDFKTRTILGETWRNGQWREKRVRFPDAIRNFERKGKSDKILDLVPYSLGFIVQKDDQLDFLSRLPSTSEYIPKTITVHNVQKIFKQIKVWGNGLFKPSTGRLGQGIVFVKMIDNEFEINDNGQVTCLDEKAFKALIKSKFIDASREYMLQQFAAGTGPGERYFNVRVIVSKGKDGDWHTCNTLMSLLAKQKSIIANRDAGSKNIDLDAFLKYKYKQNVHTVYDELFSAAIKITRELDDLSNNSSEEIALDMAIDNNGKVWLHEANWRGGLWLFDEDVGIYRHGGGNLNRIATQNCLGSNSDRANACKIAIKSRKAVNHYLFQKDNCALDDGVVFGLDMRRFTDSTISTIVEAMTYMVPIISISTNSSIRKTQRIVYQGMELLKDQIPMIKSPWLLSKGGACVYDLEDERNYTKWIDEELSMTHIVTEKDLLYGYSIQPVFLEKTVLDIVKDLRIECLDTFVLEGLEYSLCKRREWKKLWLNAALCMQKLIKKEIVKQWGISLNAKTFNRYKYTNIRELLDLLTADIKYLPEVLVLEIDSSYSIKKIKNLVEKVSSLPLRCVFSLSMDKIVKKEWNETHQNVPFEHLDEIKKYANNGQVVLCSAEKSEDVSSILKFLTKREEISDIKLLFKEIGNPWFYTENNEANILGKIKMIQNTNKVKRNPLLLKKGMEALAKMAKFDHRQFFRFFVDGRFHKKYEGWVGYENNERGSVPALLKAYAYMLDNFDLTEGLQPSYVRNLHGLIMKNVITSNPKSTPGDMRFLEAGLNIYARYSTLNSIQEIINMRKGDGTPLFHVRGFEKPADEFSAEEIFSTLQHKKRLRFRPWYPSLTVEQLDALHEDGDLDKFYEVKHFIQRGFASRLDAIIHEYNEEIKRAKSDDEKLIAISRIARNIEILHPFPDGNGRIAIALLMNHLLLFNGFLAAILYDPNIDIELSVEEFAQEIKGGIENTKLLLENPEAVIYDYSIKDAKLEAIESFKKLSKGVISRLSPYADLIFDMQKEKGDYRAHYLYLIPARLTQITKGTWMNVLSEKVEKLRFEAITVEESKELNQLFFFRNLSSWSHHSYESPLEYIEYLSQEGVLAIVVDNIDIARSSSLPALYVKDVDDALYDVAKAVRKEVNCKAVTVTGSYGKTAAKSLLVSILKAQINVHTLMDSDNKTAHIMASLANLRLTDNLEINEVDISTRVNPVRHRSKAILPDVCMITNFDTRYIEDYGLIDDEIGAHAAIVDGIKDGGLCIINSQTPYLDKLMDAIMQRRDIAIQTYGTEKEDIGRLIKADFNREKMKWNVEVDILGHRLNYIIGSYQSYLPLMSVGTLLTAYNLGYDIELAASMFDNCLSLPTSGTFHRLKNKEIDFSLYLHAHKINLEIFKSAIEDCINIGYKGKLIVVISDLINEKSNNYIKQQHIELVKFINEAEVIQNIVTLGDNIKVSMDIINREIDFNVHATTVNEIEVILDKQIESNDMVLIIGEPSFKLGSFEKKFNI